MERLVLETAIGPVLALPLGKLNAARCRAAAAAAPVAAAPSGAGEAMAGETQDPVPSRAASRASHHQRPPHSGANDQRLAGETLDAARNHGTACGAPFRHQGVRRVTWLLRWSLVATCRLLVVACWPGWRRVGSPWCCLPDRPCVSGASLIARASST